MSLRKTILTGKSGGKILDIASGSGDHIEELIEILDDFIEAVGIDISDKHFDEARDKFKDKPVTFLKMDAACMKFEDNTFDIVTMSAGMHHLDDIRAVLREMIRVLKPGGRLYIHEMICDNQTVKQLSDVNSDHWRARIDRLLGIPHNSTLKKQEILDFVKQLKLKDIESEEFICRKCDPEKDGKTEDIIADIDKKLARIENHPQYEMIKQEGEEIRQYIKKHGFACATQLDVTGIK